MRDDTIAAIATAPGSGAIAVIRVSGKDTFEIVQKIFVPKNKDKSLARQKGYTIIFGEIKEGDKTIDEVLLSVFRAPHSYTGEDSVEISCHGSLYIQQKILELLIESGARVAQPGEFTMRAFLNGKMNLSEAEAVADLIASRSEAARRIAFDQMRGGFTRELSLLRTKLVDFVSLIELELDFAEEDVEFADRDRLKQLIDEIMSKIGKLKDSFSLGNAIKNGIPVAIAGRPNVGKSTLLNALLKEDKAIVSDIPGTTRDAIEDVISIKGILFRFIDTAGLRHTTDNVEAIGIERAKEAVKKARIVLYLVDASDRDWKSKVDEISELLDGKKLIVVFNKIDKSDFELPQSTDFDVVGISAKYSENLHRLEELLLKAAGADNYSENDVIITNTRHYEALSRAYEAAERVRDSLDTEIPTDLLAQDVREVMYYLGEITGEISTDEILGNIFKNFCIGK